MTKVAHVAPLPIDVALLVLPVFHIYGMNAVLGVSLQAGATVVLAQRFDPADTLDLIARTKVTVLVGAPPMFTSWLELSRTHADLPDVSRVRFAVSGAAPLPPATYHAFWERFGVRIWEGYGLTEASSTVTSNGVSAEPKPGSIGLPLPGIEVRLVDEDGDDVEEGDPGEMWVRGPNVFAGYWHRPDATAAAFDGEWLKTGDVAYRDEQGYLFLVDRKKDLIIVSGFNVFPHEVEDAIERHPKVAEAAVVGIPDEHSGEAVQAWVVPKEGASVTPEEILDFLHGYLARFKWPKDVQVVDELPHLVTGKVLRRALRGEELLGGHAGDESDVDGDPEDEGSPE
jgi:long-chain acyl-CoA synthetase